jgi:hypothetical protein
MTTEQMLERAINIAGNGIKNPNVVISELVKIFCENPREHFDIRAPKHVCPDLWHFVRFHAAAMKAAGGSLVEWYGLNGSHRTLADTVRLFEDALFDVQVGAS